MMFVDLYLNSINSSNLIDDATHNACMPLGASALSNSVEGEFIGNGIGALLARVKYGASIPKSANFTEVKDIVDGVEILETKSTNLFEGNSANLAELTQLWRAEVRKKGLDRKWTGKNQEHTPYALHAALTLFQRVADRSLAYWLDGHCVPCQGSGKVIGEAGAQLRIYECQCCHGSGKEQVTGHRLEVDRIYDMVSELEGIFQSYNRRAGARIRKNE